MLDILRNFVAETTTPEVLSALEKSHDTFDRLDVPDYNDGFEQILMLHDEVDAGTTLQDICDLTTSIQHKWLAYFAIVVSEDAPMSFLDEILRGMLLIPEYDNKELMAKTAKLDGDAVEVLCEILALVTALKPEEMLPHIESASQFTITRIIEMSTENDAEGLSHDEAAALVRDRDNYVQKLKLFMFRIQTEDLIVAKFLQDGLSVGYPFQTYADIAEKDFQGMVPSLAAVEFFGMALVSCDGSANPSAVIKRNMERYVHDMDIATKINLQVKDLQLAMER